MKGETNASGGIGFVGLLTISFIVLKLTNFIDWSWWWVLSPIWIGIVVFLVVAIIIIVFAILMEVVKAIIK